MTQESADIRERLLDLLLSSPGKAISGEAVSRELGMTRAAVWRHMQALQDAGWPLECVTRRGYSLPTNANIPYSAAGIRCCLANRMRSPGEEECAQEAPASQDGADIRWRISFLEQVDSTSTRLKELATEGEPEGGVLVAEEQTGGRGRMGRTWMSRPGLGVWMSILLRPDMPPERIQAVTLAVSVAVVGTLREWLGEKEKNHPGVGFGTMAGEIGIKWPNDVLWRGRKLCGILTELAAEPERISHVVVGIGLNVMHETADFPMELQETAVSLKQALASIGRETDMSAGSDRNQLAALLLQHLSRVYRAHRHGGLAKILEQWRQASVTLGRTIRVMAPEGAWLARAMDVGEDGKLLVEREDGERRWLLSGEISIR